MFSAESEKERKKKEGERRKEWKKEGMNEGRNEFRWGGRWGGSGKSQGGETILRIYCIKIYFQTFEKGKMVQEYSKWNTKQETFLQLQELYGKLIHGGAQLWKDCRGHTGEPSFLEWPSCFQRGCARLPRESWDSPKADSVLGLLSCLSIMTSYQSSYESRSV